MRLANPALVLFAALAVAPAGCADDSTSLSADGTSPAGAFTPGLAILPVGIVLGFDAFGDRSTPITAAVDDATIASVTPTQQSGHFVLVGLAVGQTTLHVYVNGNDATNVPVQVIASAE